MCCSHSQLDSPSIDQAIVAILFIEGGLLTTLTHGCKVTSLGKPFAALSIVSSSHRQRLRRFSHTSLAGQEARLYYSMPRLLPYARYFLRPL
jgi:hypothetical protein